MQDNRYSAADIRVVEWGSLAQLSDGHWQTVWKFELEVLDATRLHEVALAASDAEAGFAVEFTLRGPTSLVVTIDTIRWGMETDYYGLTYQLFKLLDAQLGTIRTIQGCPRNSWSVFMSDRKDAGQP